METNTVESPAPVRMSNAEMSAAIAALVQRVEALEAAAAPVPKGEAKEMTDADAERVTYGDLASAKHKEAAAQLGLTYGQVYSARGEFTFKAVHKAAKDSGRKNTWAK